MDLQMKIILGHMTAVGADRARLGRRLPLMGLLAVALQVGDAAEGGVAVRAAEARLPGAVQPQPMIFVLCQRVERQLALAAAFSSGVCLFRVTNSWPRCQPRLFGHF